MKLSGSMPWMICSSLGSSRLDTTDMIICSGCRAFKALMAERGFEVDFVDITASVANLREFLMLRDTNEQFAPIRAAGRIGIPAFVREDGIVTLDENEALAWIGQPPMEEQDSGCATCK